MGKGEENPNRGIEHQVGGLTYAQYQALNDYLPSVLKTGIDQTLPVEQGLLAASRAVTPGYAALQAQTYGQYAPQISAASSAMEAQRQQAQAAADAAVLRGSGADAQAAMLENLKLTDPEYFRTRALEADKYSQLLGGMNPNQLTGSEMAEMERGINFAGLNRGTYGTGNATQTAADAMQFGNALQTKRDALTKALDSATAFLQPSRVGTNVDTASLGAGRVGSANPANTLFPGITQTGNQTFGMVNQALGGQAGLASSMIGSGTQKSSASPWGAVGSLLGAGIGALAAPATMGAGMGAMLGSGIGGNIGSGFNRL